MKRGYSFIVILLLIGSSEVFSQTSTINYTSSTVDFPNPERGIYHHTETHSASYSLLNQTTLINYRTNENVTLILRNFYLENFVSSAISAAYLANMQTDFNTIRNAGLKCVIRFAYTDQYLTVAPYGDATKASMLNHIAQLEPVLRANADIIAVVQAGFIGTWGEWYYTTYFGDPNNGALTNTNYADRKEVAERLLTALPTSRMIQVRTPFYKYQIFNAGSLTPLNNGNAFNGSNLSRIGHHNDCYLASSTDFGTYLNKATEYPYLTEETKYTPMGGETCALNAPRTDCAGDALTEFALFHWSFLNIDYINTVWNAWTSQGCSLTVRKNLGYRFQLNSGTYSINAKQGGSFHVTFNISNLGWAAPYNPRNVEVVLKNIVDNKLCRVKLPVEPRSWLPGVSNVLDFDIGIPNNFPNGQYKIYLSLSDPQMTLYENSNYSIRLANTDIPWDNSKGYNDLNHTLTINNGFSFANYSGSLWLEECYGSLPVQLLNFQTDLTSTEVEIQWSSTNEVNFEKYILEKSLDGIHFTNIYTALPDHSGSLIKNYLYHDPITSSGIIYYRLVMVDKDGTKFFSDVRSVSIAKIPFTIIYPSNPDNEVILKINSFVRGEVTLELIDLSGKKIYQENFFYSGQDLTINKNQKRGLYILKIIFPDGSEYFSKVMVE